MNVPVAEQPRPTLSGQLESGTISSSEMIKNENPVIARMIDVMRSGM